MLCYLDCPFEGKLPKIRFSSNKFKFCRTFRKVGQKLFYFYATKRNIRQNSYDDSVRYKQLLSNRI